MKTLFIVLFAAIIHMTGFAQSSVEKVKPENVEFKVYGNCAMCKTRIEKALKVDGVTSAEWSKKTKMVKVSFDPARITVEKMHQLLANVGHDTELVRAKDETYDKLHGCCKYDRETGTSDKKQKDKKNSNK